MVAVDRKSLKVGEGAQSPQCTAVVDRKSQKIGEVAQSPQCTTVVEGSH